MLSSAGVRWFAIAWELSLAAGLLLRPGSWLYHRLAVLTFAVFAIINLFRLIFGARTCCCFGNFEMHTGIALSIDLVMLAALVAAKLCGAAETSRRRNIVTCLALLLVSGSAGAIGQWNEMRNGGRLVEYSIQATPELIDLGRIERGGKREVHVSLRNTSNGAIVVSNIRTSCECLAIESTCFALARDAIQDLKATVDFMREPEFFGSLVLPVTGMNQNGETVFRFVIELTVLEK